MKIADTKYGVRDLKKSNDLYNDIMKNSPFQNDPGFPWTGENIKALFVGYMRDHATDLLMLLIATALIWLAW